MKKFKIEVKAYKNEELGLWYLDNRAFDMEEGSMTAYLDVVNNKGEVFDLDSLVESNKGLLPVDVRYVEVTVDDIDWTFVEEVVDKYSDTIDDQFISGCEYLNRYGK